MSDLQKTNNRLIGALVFVSLIAISGWGKWGLSVSKWAKKIEALEAERDSIVMDVERNDSILKMSMTRFEGLIQAQDSIISDLKRGLEKSKLLSANLKGRADSIGIIKDDVMQTILNSGPKD